ncbi:hypothetical protein JW707_03995 [Candidatus Woesearchaeota archaeon]|nr:hypothetical protein [Candidatus Woesearchaeota archaeon]
MEPYAADTLEAKVELTLDILRLESTNSFYGQDFESRQFLIHFGNYLNGKAGTSKTVTKDLIPKISQYNQHHGVDSSLNFFKGINSLSTLVTLFFSFFALGNINGLPSLPDPSDRMELASYIVLDLTVAALGLWGYFMSRKEIKKCRQIKEKLGNPAWNKEDRKLWEEAVVEIYSNPEYRQKALEYVEIKK